MEMLVCAECASKMGNSQAEIVSLTSRRIESGRGLVASVDPAIRSWTQMLAGSRKLTGDSSSIA